MMENNEILESLHQALKNSELICLHLYTSKRDLQMDECSIVS